MENDSMKSLIFLLEIVKYLFPYKFEKKMYFNEGQA
jgi:hypothetical protein